MLTRSILSNSLVCRYVIFVKALLFMPSFVQTVKSRSESPACALFGHHKKTVLSWSLNTNKESTVLILSDQIDYAKKLRPIGNLKPRNKVTSKNTANNAQNKVTGFCFLPRTSTISIMPMVNRPNRNFNP